MFLEVFPDLLLCPEHAPIVKTSSALPATATAFPDVIYVEPPTIWKLARFVAISAVQVTAASLTSKYARIVHHKLSN